MERPNRDPVLWVCHTAMRPPSTGTGAPWPKLASSPARNVTAAAICAGRPGQPVGAVAASWSSASRTRTCRSGSQRLLVRRERAGGVNHQVLAQWPDSGLR